MSRRISHTVTETLLGCSPSTSCFLTIPRVLAAVNLLSVRILLYRHVGMPRMLTLLIESSHSWFSGFLFEFKGSSSGTCGNSVLSSSTSFIRLSLSQYIRTSEALRASSPDEDSFVNCVRVLRMSTMHELDMERDNRTSVDGSYL